MSPEYLLALREQHSEAIKVNMEKCDIFSLGMILMKCCLNMTEAEMEKG